MRLGCVNFATQMVGAIYGVGDRFQDSGVEVTIEQFQWANGTWTTAGRAVIEDGDNIISSSPHIWTNNVNLSFVFPRPLYGLRFRFSQWGGNQNLRVNGNMTNIATMVDMHGQTVGQVRVIVETDNAITDHTEGTVRLMGLIETFAIGGQELAIDDICPVVISAEDAIAEGPGIYASQRCNCQGNEEIDNPGITRYFLVSEYLVAEIEEETGILSGLWDKKVKKQIIEQSYDKYYIETNQTIVKDWMSDERVNSGGKKSNLSNNSRLVIENICNPDLLGITFEKTYFFAKVNSEERILCCHNKISSDAQSVRETILLKLASMTVFSDDMLTDDAFYDRVFPTGTTGDVRRCLIQEPPWPDSQLQQMTIGEIKTVGEPMIQRAWFDGGKSGFGLEQGRAQFSLVKLGATPPETIGLAQYLFKVDGEWTYPQGITQSFWHSYGWEMGGAGDFFPGKNTVGAADHTTCYEMRYHLFHNSRLQFHFEYRNLPEHPKATNNYVSILYPNQCNCSHAKLKKMVNWAINKDIIHFYSSLQALSLHAVDNQDTTNLYDGITTEFIRSNELMIGDTGPCDKRWGVYPTGNDEQIVPPLEPIKQVKDIKQALLCIHTRWRFVKTGFTREINHIYWPSCQEQIDASIESAYLRDKELNAIMEDGNFVSNWRHEIEEMDQCPALNSISIGEEYACYIYLKLLKELDEYPLDMVYLDFPSCIWLVNWGEKDIQQLCPGNDPVSSRKGYVIKPPFFAKWLQRLHKEIRARAGFLHVNSFVDQYCYDMGYQEVTYCELDGSDFLRLRYPWRATGNYFLMRKLYTHPDNVCIPHPWKAGKDSKDTGEYNELRYRNLVLASGLKAAACQLEPRVKHFPDGTKDSKGNPGTDQMAILQYQHPVLATTMELIPSQFVEIGLEPAWWSDFDTQLEAYTLKQGKSYLVNVILHCGDRDELGYWQPVPDFTVDPSRMEGFDIDREYYGWQYFAKDQKYFDDIKYPNNNFPQGKVVMPDDWRDMFTEYRFIVGNVGKNEHIKVPLPSLKPGTVRMTCLTQVPAFIYSASDDYAPPVRGGIHFRQERRTQLLLTDNLGCTVRGDLDLRSKKANLVVEATQQVRVICYWPFTGLIERPPVISAVRGKIIPLEMISFPGLEGPGGYQFVQFLAEMGTHVVEISSRRRLHSTA